MSRQHRAYALSGSAVSCETAGAAWISRRAPSPGAGRLRTSQTRTTVAAGLALVTGWRMRRWRGAGSVTGRQTRPPSCAWSSAASSGQVGARRGQVPLPGPRRLVVVRLRLLQVLLHGQRRVPVLGCRRCSAAASGAGLPDLHAEDLGQRAGERRRVPDLAVVVHQHPLQRGIRPGLPDADWDTYTGSKYSRPPPTGRVTRLPWVTWDPPWRSKVSAEATVALDSKSFCTCCGPRIAVSCGSCRIRIVP